MAVCFVIYFFMFFFVLSFFFFIYHVRTHFYTLVKRNTDVYEKKLHNFDECLFNVHLFIIRISKNLCAMFGLSTLFIYFLIKSILTFYYHINRISIIIYGFFWPRFPIQRTCLSLRVLLILALVFSTGRE